MKTHSAQSLLCVRVHIQTNSLYGKTWELGPVQYPSWHLHTKTKVKRENELWSKGVSQFLQTLRVVLTGDVLPVCTQIVDSPSPVRKTARWTENARTLAIFQFFLPRMGCVPSAVTNCPPGYAEQCAITPLSRCVCTEHVVFSRVASCRGVGQVVIIVRSSYFSAPCTPNCVVLIVLSVYQKFRFSNTLYNIT